MRNIKPAHFPAYRNNEWIGLSTDDRELIKESLQDGDLFYEMDTSKVLRYSKDKDEWYNAPVGGGGGGSSGEGTDNYNELLNKPKINGVTLIGDKATDDFGLVDINALNKKQDKLTAGNGIEIVGNQIKTNLIDDAQPISTNKTYSINKIKEWVKDENAGIKYKHLVDKPKIEGVEIDGNKNASDYHLINDDRLTTELAKKQDKLTAGKNIKLNGATIEADTIDDTVDGSVDKSMSVSGLKSYIQTSELIDYTKLKNMPKLEGKTITGSQTADYYGLAKKVDLDKKQDKLTAGKNVTIDTANKIAVDIIDDNIEQSTTKVMSVTGIKNYIGAPLKYIGVVSTTAELNSKPTTAGHIYTVTSDKTNYVCDSNKRWQILSRTDIDMANYYNKAETDKTIDDDVDAHDKLTTAHQDIRDEVDKRVKKDDKAASADVTAGSSDKWIDSAILKSEQDKDVKKTDKATANDVAGGTVNKWVDAALLNSEEEKFVKAADKATEFQAKAYTADKWIDGVGLKAVVDNGLVKQSDKATHDDLLYRDSTKWLNAGSECMNELIREFKEEVEDIVVLKENKATSTEVQDADGQHWASDAFVFDVLDQYVSRDDKATQQDIISKQYDKWVDARNLQEYAEKKLTVTGVVKRNSDGTYTGVSTDDAPTKDSENLVTSGGVYDVIPHLYEHNIDMRPSGYQTVYMRIYTTSQEKMTYSKMYDWFAERTNVRIQASGGTYYNDKSYSVFTLTYVIHYNDAIELRGTVSKLSNTVGLYENRSPTYGGTVKKENWLGFDTDGKSTIRDAVVKIF